MSTAAVTESKTGKGDIVRDAGPKEALREEAQQRVPERSVIPEYEVKKGPSAYTIIMRMPGVAESDLDLQVKDSLLTVKGRSEHPVYDGFNLVYSELPNTDYEAGFRLPEGIDDEGISARLANGVLQITLPKAREEDPKRISVNVS